MTEPPMGHCHGGVHIFAARIYYEDTDAGGVAYHTSYLRLAERARTEMMRCAGFSHGELLERFDVLFALRRCTVDFRLPARLDDALEVRTRVARVAGASFEGRQRHSSRRAAAGSRWRRRWPASRPTAARPGFPPRFAPRSRIFA